MTKQLKSESFSVSITTTRDALRQGTTIKNVITQYKFKLPFVDMYLWKDKSIYTLKLINSKYYVSKHNENINNVVFTTVFDKLRDAKNFYKSLLEDSGL